MKFECYDMVSMHVYKLSTLKTLEDIFTGILGNHLQKENLFFVTSSI